MPTILNSRPMRYGLAAIFVAGMFALRLALTPIFGQTYPLVYFTLAIVAAARVGGRGPGLAATALSVVGADYFFATPLYSLAVSDPAEIVGLLMLAATGVGISWLVPAERGVVKTARVHPHVFTAIRLRRIVVLGSAVVVNLMLSWVLYSDFEREREAEVWVKRTYQVLTEIRQLTSALEDAEANQRAYLLTGDTRYQGALESAVVTVGSCSRVLHRLAADNRAQLLLNELDRLSAARIVKLRQSMAIRAADGLEAAAYVIATGEGARSMENCRAVLERVENRERELLQTRSNAADTEALRTRWVLGLGSGSLLVLLVIAGVVIEGDVQRRERDRLQVQQSDQRLRLALEAASASTWEWDAETNQSTWSEELWKLFSLSRHASEPSYAEWREAVHPEDRERAETAFRQAAATAADLSIEFRVRGREGHERWLLTRARQLRVRTGEAARLIGIALDITDRKQVEQALWEHERTLRRFTDVAPAAMAMFDRNMRYLAVSERFRKDFDLNDQDLIGRSHYDVFPEIPEHWRAVHQRCLAGAVARHPGERFVRADGSEQWIRWEVQPWQQTDGEIGGIVIFSEDITQQVRSEQALRESEERFRALVTASSDVVYRMSPDWSEMYYLDGREFIASTQSASRDWLEAYIPATERPRVTAAINEAIRTKSIFELEHRVLRVDGSVGWTFSRAIPRLNAKGEIIEWFGAASDITRRKEAEQALRESEERVRRKLETILSPDPEIGVLEFQDVVDIEAIRSIMADFSELSGIVVGFGDSRANILVGTGWQEICTRFHRVHPETCANCNESDAQFLEGVTPGEYRLYKCRNNLWDAATPLMLGGKSVGNIYTGQLLLDDEPVSESEFVAQAARYGFDEQEYLDAFRKVPRMSRKKVGTAIDFLRKFGELVGKLGYANVKLAKSLAQLQSSEETVRRLNAELEQRVRERTAELEAANKELETFCYSVSHDLRAPLRGIDGWSLALVEDYGGRLDPTAQTYLDRVRSEAQRMGLLIDDLLQLSRVTRAAMNRRTVDLAAAANAVASRLREQYADRRIHFMIDPDLVATGDVGLLEIALTNLLGNSAKFTGREAQAQIEFGQTKDRGGRAFYVRDNGVGFDMAYADTLFGAFQRLHKPADFPGTGIGLATVQRIIHRHGGRIWAEAEVGHGATFYFTLGESS